MAHFRTFKNGGLRFFQVGRVNVSFSVSRHRAPLISARVVDDVVTGVGGGAFIVAACMVGLFLMDMPQPKTSCAAYANAALTECK